MTALDPFIVMTMRAVAFIKGWVKKPTIYLSTRPQLLAEIRHSHVQDTGLTGSRYRVD